MLLNSKNKIERLEKIFGIQEEFTPKNSPLSTKTNNFFEWYKTICFSYIFIQSKQQETQILLSIIKEVPKGKLILRLDEVLTVKQTTLHQVLVLLRKLSIEVEWVYLFDLLTSASPTIQVDQKIPHKYGI